MNAALQKFLNKQARDSRRHYGPSVESYHRLVGPCGSLKEGTFADLVLQHRRNHIFWIVACRIFQGLQEAK
jgi:hypothetical protein